jgi:hypothetical protein
MRPNLNEDWAITLASRCENGPNGCINWTGWKDKQGYGRVWIGSKVLKTGRAVLTHRLSAAVWLGFDLGSRLQVLHKCDNPSCINPDHFFFGTNDDNVADKMAKGRNGCARGERNGASTLTAPIVSQIRLDRTNGAKYSSMSSKYGIPPNYLCKIVTRQRWAHVD